MACLYPIKAYKMLTQTSLETGKHPIKICKKNDPYKEIQGREKLLLPCGRCMACRKKKSREWALRASHEAFGHEDKHGESNNCIIALTYDNKHLPADSSLDKNAISSFMKRLRQTARRGFTYYDQYDQLKWYQQSSGIRFLGCGEYGDNFARPHYHIILFNFKFPDAQLFNATKEISISKTLSKIWTNGIHSIQECTFDGCCYVARYINKKINGPIAPDHYQGRQPEYLSMSQGLGKDWYKKYKNDAYNTDQIYLRSKGIFLTPPRYYDTLYEREFPEKLKLIKERRVEKAKELQTSQTPLASREIILKKQDERQVRTYEKINM